MVSVQKWPLFQLFFLGNIGQENVFYDIIERKNAFVSYKRKKVKKSKIDIFPKRLTHIFDPKKAIFPRFFQGNKKTRSLKKRKIDIFLNELTHCFGPKIAIFPTFFFRNIGQENVFYDILKQKKSLSRL